MFPSELAQRTSGALKFKCPRLRKIVLSKIEVMDGSLTWEGEFAYKVISSLQVRVPELEPEIIKRPYLSSVYIKNVIRGPWPEAEPALAVGPPCFSLSYALDQRKRFPEAEPTFINEIVGRKSYFEDEIAKDEWFEDIEDYILEYVTEWPELEEVFQNGGWFRRRVMFSTYANINQKPIEWFERELVQNTEDDYYTCPLGGGLLLGKMSRTIAKYIYFSYKNWEEFMEKSILFPLLEKSPHPFEREFYGIENSCYKPERLR